MWRALDRAIDWFVLTDGKYRQKQPGADGIFRSDVFPGLWLDGMALLERSHAQAIESMQRGLQTAEHAEFVKRLAATRSDAD